MVMRAAVLCTPHVGAEQHDALHAEMDGEIDRALQASALTNGAGTIEAEARWRHLAPQSQKTPACGSNRYRDDAAREECEGLAPAVCFPPTAIAEEQKIGEWGDLVTGIDNDYAPTAQEREVLIKNAGAAGNNESGLARPLRRNMPPMHHADGQIPIDTTVICTGGGNVGPSEIDSLSASE